MTNSAAKFPLQSRMTAIVRGGGKQGEGGNAQGVRLQRFLAQAGAGSRRACEEMILEGRVSVNGRRTNALPVFIDPAKDRILVDGVPVAAPSRDIYLMFHKPAGMMASMQPADGRRTIGQAVDHPARSRLLCVGGLEYSASGIVLLVSDRALAQKLTSPRSAVPRAYEILVKRSPDDHARRRLAKGVRVRAMGSETGVARQQAASGARSSTPVRAMASAVGVVKLRVEPGGGSEQGMVRAELVAGRDALVGDAMVAVGCPVRKVSRVAFGPLRLTGVGPGRWRELTRDEVRRLRRSVKPGAGRDDTLGA